MILKWIFDRFVSLFGLLFLWPVLLVVAILIKTKNTPAQHELSFDEREENIKGAYRTNKSIQIDKNKKLLICDDIITTGRTLKECIKTLKSDGFKNIYCATIAYTQ